VLLDKKRILLIGSNGLLGSQLYLKSSYFSEFLGTHYKTVSNSNSVFLDVTDIDSVYSLVLEFKPNVIINCSAYTNVDKAELNKKNVRDVNVLGLQNIIKSSSIDTKIVHISSDYVFDGEKGDYKESDPTHPVNYYGKTKLESENILKGANRSFIIYRPNVLYSDDINSLSFFSWVLKSLKNNKEIKVVDDQISNPIYIADFVDVILDSLLMGYEGVLHIGSEDSLSRYQFALKIAHVFGFGKRYSDNITPIKTKSLNQLAERPKKSNLNCDKIVQDLNFSLKTTDYYLNKICKIRYKTT